MNKIFAMILLLFLASCLKTTDKLITAQELCADLEHLMDDEDLRDDHDECLLETDERIRTEEGCTKECETYCSDHDMVFHDMWVDIAGCRCTCQLTLSSE